MTAVYATLNPLSWESQFFDINSSLVCINDGAELLTQHRLNCWSRVQAKIPACRTDLLDNLQTLGFSVVEGEVDLCLKVEPCENIVCFEIAQNEHVDALRELAAQVFQHSRFRSPWYQPHDSGRFYAQWVENAVYGTFDHQCLLLTENKIIRGFVTLRQINEREARIGLLAGRRMGNALIAAAKYWCQQRGLKTLHVATQMSNQAALRLYIQCGATINRTAFWLYR